MRLTELPFLQPYLYYLVHLKGLVFGFGRTHFGQWGEDIVIGGLLKGSRGFYVDVGAFHPMHYSNTYLLYRRGWRGVNIDPNPRAKVLFELHRPRDTTITSGVGSVASVQTYYVFNHASCNTFSPEHRDRMLRRPFMQVVGTADVPIEPLQTILDRKAPGVAIDFLNIDVEGMNLEVLKSIDWSRTHPKVLCVEDDDFDFGTVGGGSQTHQYLTGKGYHLVARMGASSIYTLLQKDAVV